MDPGFPSGRCPNHTVGAPIISVQTILVTGLEFNCKMLFEIVHKSPYWFGKSFAENSSKMKRTEPRGEGLAWLNPFVHIHFSVSGEGGGIKRTLYVVVRSQTPSNEKWNFHADSSYYYDDILNPYLGYLILAIFSDVVLDFLRTFFTSTCKGNSTKLNFSCAKYVTLNFSLEVWDKMIY